MDRLFRRPRPGLARLFVYLLVFVGTAGLINAWIFTGTGEAWAVTLNNPSWSPPGYVIGAVWTVLFGLIAIGAFLIDRADSTSYRLAARVSLVIWWLICVSWPILYFQVQSVANGFYVTVQAVIVGFIAMPVIFQASRPAGYTLLPLQLWLLFALYLSWRTFQLNV